MTSIKQILLPTMWGSLLADSEEWLNTNNPELSVDDALAKHIPDFVPRIRDFEYGGPDMESLYYEGTIRVIDFTLLCCLKYDRIMDTEFYPDKEAWS